MKAFVFEGDADEVAIALRTFDGEKTIVVEEPERRELPEPKVVQVKRKRGRPKKAVVPEPEPPKDEVERKYQEMRVPVAVSERERISDILEGSAFVDEQILFSVLKHVAVMGGTMRFHPDGMLLGYENISAWERFLSRFAMTTPRISRALEVKDKWKIVNGTITYG